VLVQQAIFSCGRRRQREGIHLVSRSAGLTRSDAQLLIPWLPWCDALSPADHPATGTCCVPLSDQSTCISRSMRLAERREGQPRGEHDPVELLTHCLVVPREVTARFADNPFALIQAIGAAGYLLTHQPAGGKLHPIRLAGRAAPLDPIVVGNLTRRLGPRGLAGLVHQAVHSERLILAGADGEEVAAGLLSLLPLEVRGRFSLSVNLRPALRRPLRLVAVPELNLQIERFARQCRYDLLEIERLSEIEFHDDPWATAVERALEESDFAQLAELVAAPVSAHERDQRRVPERQFVSTESSAKPAAKMENAMQMQAAVATAADRQGRPRHDEAENDPAALEMLERLDDLVYDAIAGREKAFDELAQFWPQVLAAIEGEALVESREQYLRYALGLWTERNAEGIQEPQRAMAALDVLCLLFPEEEF
jgi:GTPase-associated protein 1, N-terminal domain type 2